MIAMYKGNRERTSTERREVQKDILIDRLRHKVWQLEGYMDKHTHRELSIILEQLQDVHSEEVQEACNRHHNKWL